MPETRKLFPSQQPGEAIYLVVREHWVPLVLKLIVVLVFAALWPVLRHMLASRSPLLLVGQSGTGFELIGYLYALIVVLAVFILLVLYYLNIQIITSIRVVDVTQEGLFDHKIAELHIDKIEDATSEEEGLLGSIFNYGNVYVQTAGNTERFTFHKVPRPAAIEKLVLDLYEKNSNFAKDTALNTDIVENTEQQS